MKDMLNELMQALATDSEIQEIQQNEGFKSYVRRDELAKEKTSITVSPSGPPESVGFASNDSLSKHFIFQVSIEAVQREIPKNLQRKVEQIFKTMGFYQMPGGIDDYFSTTKRYVDARFYQGNSRLYDDDY
ncbi:hypothetical protein [Lactococcus lactis]|uniref:Phage protein n=1 Tax=Lactococcus lactis TaxID=1358 RepID=A0AAP3Z2L8_9LACT|nr:hypothetical protein [Lactococcus lactis]MDG4969256.1 hypothetical protein [Lactococcus lactis]MDG4977187.1 hypothetical protein [Lactococcus lactis]MDG5103350.1 hypothetical protein [Lactococcus lactis]TNU78252.1 hypothetical protein FIB48_09455 [Lactococcus lactis subsp. lactis]